MGMNVCGMKKSLVIFFAGGLFGAAVILGCSGLFKEAGVATTSSPQKRIKGQVGEEQIRDLFSKRAWGNSSNDLVYSLADAFTESVLYSRMPRENFELIFGSSFDEVVLHGKEMKILPLNYTWESLPEVGKNSTIGAQWYLVFEEVPMQGEVKNLSLRYGSPKTWMLFDSVDDEENP